MPRYIQPLSGADARVLEGRRTAGVLVLFDIADSTRRKQRTDAVWLRETAIVYLGFKRLVDALAKILESDEPHRKFIGDGLFAFLPLGDALSGELDDDAARRVLREVNRFRDEVADAGEKLLGGMQLKSVVTFLRGPRELGGEYLNRGVDFSFRLEKAGDPHHVVVNDQFFAALGSDGARALGLTARKRRRTLKGWDAPQTFRVLVD